MCLGHRAGPEVRGCYREAVHRTQRGHYDDVFVIRDGQKLKFEEVATFEPESEDADGE